MPGYLATALSLLILSVGSLTQERAVPGVVVGHEGLAVGGGDPDIMTMQGGPGIACGSGGGYSGQGYPGDWQASRGDGRRRPEEWGGPEPGRGGGAGPERPGVQGRRRGPGRQRREGGGSRGGYGVRRGYDVTNGRQAFPGQQGGGVSTMIATQEAMLGPQDNFPPSFEPGFSPGSAGIHCK